jgi:hypothetical protein
MSNLPAPIHPVGPAEAKAQHEGGDRRALSTSVTSFDSPYGKRSRLWERSHFKENSDIASAT